MLLYKEKLKIFHDTFVKYSFRELDRQRMIGTQIFNVHTLLEKNSLFNDIACKTPVIDIIALLDKIYTQEYNKPKTAAAVNSVFDDIGSDIEIHLMLSDAIIEVAIDFESKLHEIQTKEEVRKYSSLAIAKLFNYLNVNPLGEEKLTSQKITEVILAQKSIWWIKVEDDFAIRSERKDRNHYKLSLQNFDTDILYIKVSKYEQELKVQQIDNIAFYNAQGAIDNFIGRTESLSQIHEYFTQTGNIIQVIGGLGGIGKTQTVLQYIKTHAKTYNYLVRWFSAENKLTLDSGFREFAQVLKIDVEKKSTEEIQQLVKNKLKISVEQSLLIFDNVEDYDLLKEYLPYSDTKQHHIIITTRNSKDFEDGASRLGIKNIIKLEPFSSTEAVDYIKTTLSETTESEALKLATLFDNIPLGLSQSVAYIKNNDIDISIYIEEYNKIKDKQSAELLSILHDSKDDQHKLNIYITLSMTLDSLSYIPKAAQVLKLCSYLNADDIPDYLFNSLFSSATEKNRVIAVLKGYSLISVRTEGDIKFINVHRIVQEVTRISTGEESVDILRTAMELVHMQMMQDYDNHSSLKNYRLTLQHAISLIDHHNNVINIDLVSILDEIAAELHNDCGVLYRILGQWNNAETSYKLSLQLFKKTFGEEHESISMVIDNLGVVYLSTERIQLALDSFFEALRIIKEDHQGVPEVLNNIGHAYLALKDTKLALENFQQAQIMFTKIYGEEHPFVAKTILNIGILYRDLAQYKISLNYFEQALNIYKIKYDDTFPAVISTINHIAVVYGYIGKHQESLVRFEKVLAIRTIIFDEDHPTIAEAINNIGATLGMLERHSEALVHLNKALKLYQESYGKESYHSAITLGHIGTTHLKCERYQESLDYYTQALNICKNTFGNKHPEVARFTGNIGQVYFQLNKYEEALENYQHALEINKIFYSETHPEIATAIDSIGNVYNELERFEEALIHYKRALVIRKAVYSDGNHFHIAISMNNIGNAYYKLKRYQKALECYEEALLLYRSIYNNKHSDIAKTLDNIGDVNKDLEQYQNALNYYQQALVIRKAIYGDKHSDIVKTISNIGLMHKNLEQYQEALENLLQVLKINRTLYGNYHLSIAIILSDIGGIYKSLYMHEEALVNYKDALLTNEVIYGEEHVCNAEILEDIGDIYVELDDYRNALANYLKASIILMTNKENNDGIEIKIAEVYIDSGNDFLEEKSFSKAIDHYNHALIHSSEDNDNHSEALSLIEEVKEKIKTLLIEDAQEYFGESSSNILNDLLENIEITDLLTEFEIYGSRHITAILLGIDELSKITIPSMLETTEYNNIIGITSAAHNILTQIDIAYLEESIQEKDTKLLTFNSLPTDHNIKAPETSSNFLQVNQYIIASFTAKEAIESAATIKYIFKEIFHMPLPELPNFIKSNYLWIAMHYGICSIGAYSITSKFEFAKPIYATSLYGARLLSHEYLATQKQISLQNEVHIDSSTKFIKNCGTDILVQASLASIGSFIYGTSAFYEIIIGSVVGGAQCYQTYKQEVSYEISTIEKITPYVADFIMGCLALSNINFSPISTLEKITSVKQTLTAISLIAITDYTTKSILFTCHDSCAEYINKIIGEAYGYFNNGNETPEL